VTSSLAVFEVAMWVAYFFGPPCKLHHDPQKRSVSDHAQ